MNLKVGGRKFTWPDTKYFLGTFVDKPRETTENTRYDSGYTDQDSKKASAYKSETNLLNSFPKLSKKQKSEGWRTPECREQQLKHFGGVDVHKE